MIATSVEHAYAKPTVEQNDGVQIGMQVAGIQYLVSSSATLTLDLAAGLKPFVSSAQPLHALKLSVSVGDLSGHRRGTSSHQQFDSEGLWWLEQHGDEDHWLFATPSLGPVPYRRVRMKSDYLSGEIVLHAPYLNAGAPVYPLEYPLDEILMVHILGRHRAGVEMHGCGLITEKGEGVLFVGKSGAGKTTTADLWTRNNPYVSVLSDDRIIIRREATGHRMFGTPWHGEGRYALPDSAPLKALFFLKQAGSNDVKTLSQGETVARLLSTSFIPSYARQTLDPSLEMLEAIAQEVPCRELSFRKDESVTEFTRALI